MAEDLILSLMIYGVQWIGFTIGILLLMRDRPLRYSIADWIVAHRRTRKTKLLRYEISLPRFLPEQEWVDWEMTAGYLFREGQESDALQLIQEKTGFDFEKSRLKLLKLDEEIMSNYDLRVGE